VPEQEFREPMPRPQQIRPNVFPTPQEIARGFFLFGGNVNGRQGAGAIQDRELTGIPPVRFDAIPRTTRNQGRRDDLAPNAPLGQRPLQLNAARPGFVAAGDGARATDALDEVWCGSRTLADATPASG
jgi:hypothetical protein